MILAIYRKTPLGQLSFHGVSTFETIDCFIQGSGLRAFTPTRDSLSADWPDRDVTWLGAVGYAIRNSGKLKMRQVNLTDDQVARAKEIGGGNVSEGIRIALGLFE